MSNNNRKNQKGHRYPCVKDIVLSPVEFDRLVEMINNPPPPTEKLLQARQRYLASKVDKEKGSHE